MNLTHSIIRSIERQNEGVGLHLSRSVRRPLYVLTSTPTMYRRGPL